MYALPADLLKVIVQSPLVLDIDTVDRWGQILDNGRVKDEPYDSNRRNGIVNALLASQLRVHAALEQPEDEAEDHDNYRKSVEGRQTVVIEAEIWVRSSHIVDHETVEGYDLSWQWCDVLLVIEHLLDHIGPAELDLWNDLKDLEVV